MTEKIFRRTVVGSNGTPYVVTLKEDFWYCTCKSYEFSVKREPLFQCKHIIQVIKERLRHDSQTTD